MSRKQDLGPGAKKIELERRLDANQDKMEQAAGGRASPSDGKRPRGQTDPNETVRQALDKSRY